MSSQVTSNSVDMACSVCGYIYQQSKGSLRDGIQPGTPFDKLPHTWVCPDCQVGKQYFTEYS